MQADSLHRCETARSDGRQDCFASADYGTHRVAVAGVARRRPDGSIKGECEVADLGVVETAQASSAVEGLNRQRRHCLGDRKSGGTANESGQESRDGRHEAGVRWMKNEPSRDDSKLREKQVDWQKTNCDAERRSSLALVRPGSMVWRNLKHEASEPRDRERAAHRGDPE